MALNWRLKIPMALAVLCAASAVYCICNASALRTEMPSDSLLLSLFQTHHSEFVRLRKMVTEDMHQRSFFSEETIVSVQPEARRNEYRKLLMLWPNLRVGVDYNGTVRFIFGSSTGLAIGPGWVKGIEFVPDDAKLIGARMNSLDEPRKLPAGVYLRKIKPHWFIFYQRDE